MNGKTTQVGTWTVEFTDGRHYNTVEVVASSSMAALGQAIRGFDPWSWATQVTISKPVKDDPGQGELFDVERTRQQ